MRFSDFVENAAAVRFLQKSFATGRLGHAYLFSGAKGLGKKTLAYLFAAGLLCGEPDPPCMTCAGCRKVLKGVHPDLTAVRKPADKSFITVDQIRGVRESVYIRPNESSRRVVVVEEADQMNPSAANALLKVLEEPPPYAVFILTAQNPDLLPSTVRSRCIQVPLRTVSSGAAAAFLRDRFPDRAERELTEGCRYGEGNLGKSLAFLEEESVRLGAQRAQALLDAAASGKDFNVMAVLAPFENDKPGLLALLDDFESLLGRVGRGFFLTDATLEAPPAGLSPQQAAKLYELIGDVRRRLFYNGNLPLTAALFGAKICGVMQ